MGLDDFAIFPSVPHLPAKINHLQPRQTPVQSSTVLSSKKQEPVLQKPKQTLTTPSPHNSGGFTNWVLLFIINMISSFGLKQQKPPNPDLEEAKRLIDQIEKPDTPKTSTDMMERARKHIPGFDKRETNRR